MQQRHASAHTIASYRDTFRLLLQFAQERLRRAPSTLALEDIDAPLVVDFLDELEKVRDVTARTRNLRLTAIHSFFRYVALRDVKQASVCRCKARVAMGDLDFKFVVHDGEMVKQKMGGREELAGRDVILVHRLLKNAVSDKVGSRAYALYSDADGEREERELSGRSTIDCNRSQIWSGRWETNPRHTAWEGL